MEIEKSLIILAEHSEVANKIVDKKLPLTLRIREVDGSLPEILPFHLNDLTFHPTGKCGCIELKDEEMFGIRCNHLMWMDGRMEEIEPFINDDEERDVILVFGNHKGGFRVRLISFSDSTDECFRI